MFKFPPLFLAIVLWSNPPIALQENPNSLKTTLNNLVQTQQVVGIIVAKVSLDSIEVQSAGSTAIGNNRPPDINTIFEIASITKAITGLLVAQAILEGKISEQAIAQSFLPNLVLPKSQRPIKLRDLVTHRSGIPRAYDNFFKPRDTGNPWADFNFLELRKFLQRTKLNNEPGEAFSYSNIGAGLVGHILENIYKTSFEQIIQQQIILPLELKNTGLRLTKEQQTRFAQAHRITDYGQLLATSHWDWTPDSVPAAGAIKSSMADMIILAKSLLDRNSKFHKLFSYAQIPRNFSNSANRETIGLFWINSGNQITWHNGGTYGMTSFIGINRIKRTAVVILSNSQFENFKINIPMQLGLNLLK